MDTSEKITAEELEKLRYPIGKMDRNVTITSELHQEALEALGSHPSELHAAVITLSDEQLDTPYRPGGWTVRQTIHHLADSHLNGYIRCKLALTEENPTIKPYEQELWAELTDTHTAPVELSLNILENLHKRWMICLRSLTPEQWNRTYFHPESGETSLALSLQNYAWHGRHHLAQIIALKERRDW